MVLNMQRVGVHRFAPELRHHAAQFCDAFFVGGNLRAQVGHVLVHVAAGVGVVGENLTHFYLAKGAPVHQFEIVDQHAFLVHMGGAGGGGAGGHAADIGMMTTRCDVKREIVVDIDRRDDRDVRQVCAAVVGRIQTRTRHRGSSADFAR